MCYQIVKFQNISPWDYDSNPTIVITKKHPKWQEALKNWRDGKFPTQDKKWKQGIFACTELIECASATKI